MTRNLLAEAPGLSQREDPLAVQLRLFASYSPADVVLRYAFSPSPAPPSAPEQEDFQGAIGFVDVSGFTALSEKLNKDHGRKGAELLNQCAPSPQRTFQFCLTLLCCARNETHNAHEHGRRALFGHDSFSTSPLTQWRPQTAVEPRPSTRG